MKKHAFFLSLLFVICVAVQPVSAQPKDKSHIIDQTADNGMDQKKLRHVVLIKFKEGTTEQEIRKVEEAFSALPEKIPVIRDYEWGLNNSPEGLNKGFTHCFLVTFDSEKDRATYLPHPEHKAFVKVLEPHLDDVLVVDYWSREG